MRILAPFLLLSTLSISFPTASIAAQAQAQTNVATVLKRGAKLVAAGRLTEAQSLYERALLDSPDDPDLRFGLGTAFFRERNWPKAIENYRSSINAKPGNVKVLYFLAEAFFMQANVDSARQTIAIAVALAPDDAKVCQKYGEYLAVNIENRKEALAWMEKARRLDPLMPRVDFDVARTQFDLTNYQAAIPNFEAALKRDAGNGEAAFYLAESHANLGAWEKAREFYTYAVTHHYEKGPAFYGLGRAHVELGEFEFAAPPLQRSLVLQPSLIKAHFQLAKAYRQLGRAADAQRESQLFAAMTDRVDTSRELAGSEEQQAWKQVKPLLEGNKEEEALALLLKLPVVDGTDQREPYYLLGTMYFTMGRKEDAKRVLLIARKQAPQSARIAAYLGMVRLSTGEEASAEDSFQSALALDSSENLALIGMGAIRYQHERWSEAITYLARSRTADPDTLYLLCDAYYRVGKSEEAALIAEVIRALGADKKSLLEKLEALQARHESNSRQNIP